MSGNVLLAVCTCGTAWGGEGGELLPASYTMVHIFSPLVSEETKRIFILIDIIVIGTLAADTAKNVN